MNITTETQNRRPVSLGDWSTAPEWVDVDLAAFLLDVDVATVDEIIDMAGVDAIERDGETLIDRESLREFWEIYHDVGDDDGFPDHA